jgi:hypothetical protein
VTSGASLFITHSVSQPSVFQSPDSLQYLSGRPLARDSERYADSHHLSRQSPERDLERYRYVLDSRQYFSGPVPACNTELYATSRQHLLGQSLACDTERYADSHQYLEEQTSVCGTERYRYADTGQGNFVRGRHSNFAGRQLNISQQDVIHSSDDSVHSTNRCPDPQHKEPNSGMQQSSGALYSSDRQIAEFMVDRYQQVHNSDALPSANQRHQGEVMDLRQNQESDTLYSGSLYRTDCNEMDGRTPSAGGGWQTEPTSRDNFRSGFGSELALDRGFL